MWESVSGPKDLSEGTRPPSRPRPLQATAREPDTCWRPLGASGLQAVMGCLCPSHCPAQGGVFVWWAFGR